MLVGSGTRAGQTPRNALDDLNGGAVSVTTCVLQRGVQQRCLIELGGAAEYLRSPTRTADSAP